MALSKIIITFNTIPNNYNDVLGIGEAQDLPQYMHMAFVDERSAQFESTGQGNAIACASYYRSAFMQDWNQNGTYTVTSVDNVVTIEAKESCVEFVEAFNNTEGRITTEIINEECPEEDDLVLQVLGFSTAVGLECSQVLYTIQTNNFLTTIKIDGVPLPPFTEENPIAIALDRGVEVVLELVDIFGDIIVHNVTTPPILSFSDFSLSYESTWDGSVITVTNNSELEATYSIDGINYQTLNTFNVALDATYTIYVKDEYGCVTTQNIYIPDWFYNEPNASDEIVCDTLHELNKGKYLNLFGKQHTMKLGFIVNAQPNHIKIFKHIQMILNTEYSIKNATVKTSENQERYIPGDHMVYRIREGMHSVPLKNPRDWEDLRGSWAYLELEIESINNQKVDLFSVITYLRKSTI